MSEQELEAKLEVLKEQLEGVDEMLVKLDKIKEQIGKYESMLGPTYMEKEESLRREAIQKREQLLLELSKHTQKEIKTASQVLEEGAESNPRSPIPLLVGWGLGLLLPVFLYFILGDWKISLLLEIVAIVASISYYYITSKRRPYDLESVVDTLKSREKVEEEKKVLRNNL
jgi:hypothetical protein